MMVTNVTNEKSNFLMEYMENKPLYNSNLKNKFLNEMIETGTISEDTAKSYARIFLVTNPSEYALGRDLSEFTFEEIETILFDFRANNRNTVESYARIISSYLKWVTNNDKTRTNVLATLRPTDFEKYLTNEETYFTSKQLRRWEDLCANFQDAVIVRLLFSGIGGKQMSEIRNLKKQDIDWDNNRLYLINTLKANKDGLPIEFTDRWLDVDDYTMSLIDGAIKHKTYQKKNGNMMQAERNNVREYTDLVENDYVVRASITKSDNTNKPVDKFVIYRRVQMLQEVFGVEEFTAKFIQRSGMIFTASELMNEGNLTLNNIKMVADKFNLNSYHNLKGFLTVDNIEKTYPPITI